MKRLTSIAAALALAASFAAQAQSSLNLGGYQVTGTYALDILNGTAGGISGLEASAVTYAADRGTLFFVGDEGTGVIEIGKTGQTLGWSTFDWAGTGTTNRDTEGLTYLGNGVLVVSEERLQDAYRFSFANGATVALASGGVSMSNTSVGNNGIEGISYDPRDGSFVTVKQQGPQGVNAGFLTFAAGVGGTSTVGTLFDPAGLAIPGGLADVQTLGGVTALVGTTAADNLLILSYQAPVLSGNTITTPKVNRIYEVSRTGVLQSFIDLSAVLPYSAIEGLTIAPDGTIYLVAEQQQLGDLTGFTPQSQLIVLSAVPEPQAWALAGFGLALLGGFARGRRNTRAG